MGRSVVAKKYPDWSPKVVIDWTEDRPKQKGGTSMHVLNERLLTDPTMKSVWKTLLKRIELKKKTQGILLLVDVYQYVICIHQYIVVHGEILINWLAMPASSIAWRGLSFL